MTSGAGGTTTAGIDVSTSAGATSTGSDAEGSSATTGALGCAGNDALPPFCYRAYAIDWEGEAGSGGGLLRVGRFGPSGELAYLMAGGDVGDPMGLAFWNGAGFDVRTWGVVPDSAGASRVPIRMFSAEHSDLLLTRGQDDLGLRVARWGPDGPLDEVEVQPTEMGSDFGPNWPPFQIADVDGDGLEEFAAGYELNSKARILVRNVDGVPTYTDVLLPNTCGYTVFGIGAGDIDGDGLGDFAMIGDCEVDEKKGGIFWFGLLWGSADGGFVGSSVEFPAEGRGGWLGVGDFDGDGLDDVAVTLGDGDSAPQQLYLEVHRSRGDRSFDPPRRVWSQGYPPNLDQPPSEGVGPSAGNFVIGDVDGDGAEDIVFANPMYALVHVFGQPASLPMLEGWSFLDDDAAPVTDLNGDGRHDFVLHRESGVIEGLVSSD